MKIEDITDENLRTLGIIICVDTPSMTEFGVDYYSYTVSDEFVGMKNIPFGTHLVFYNFSNSSNQDTFQNSARICLFVTLTPTNPIVVLKYNKETEDYDLLEPSESNEAKQIVNKYLYEFSHRLGEYPMDQSDAVWKNLANYITKQCVERLQPLNKKILSTLSLEESQLLKRQKEEFHQYRGEEVPADEDRSYRVFYTHIPRKLTKRGANAQELTKLNYDKTALLQQLLTTEFESNPEYLLGELQFAFVCFLLGQALDALEQWKQLIELLCNCEDAVHDPSLCLLMTQFITVLHKQLEVSPPDFFHDELSGNNFLWKQLRSLFTIVFWEDVTDQNLIRAANKLKQLLVQRFNVIIEDEDDPEDAPVIVDDVSHYF